MSENSTEMTPLLTTSTSSSEPEETKQLSEPKSKLLGLQFNLKTCLGVLLVVTTGLLFTMANVVQKLSPGVHHFHLLTIRALAQISVTSVYLWYNGENPLGPAAHRPRILTQGLLGGCLLCSIYVAVRRVPLGNASAIFFSMPMFTFVFAALMLSEPMRVYRSSIALLLLAGVLNITRPPLLFEQYHVDDNDDSLKKEEKFDVVGYVFALCVPVLSAIVSILTRQLRDVCAAVLVLWFGIGALCVAILGLLFSSSESSWSEMYSVLELASIGVVVILGILGNLIYTLAVRWVTPSKANVFRSFEVILNYVLQLYIEKLAFHLSCVFGILALVVAVLLTGFEAEVKHRFSHRLSYL